MTISVKKKTRIQITFEPSTIELSQILFFDCKLPLYRLNLFGRCLWDTLYIHILAEVLDHNWLF